MFLLEACNSAPPPHATSLSDGETEARGDRNLPDIVINSHTWSCARHDGWWGGEQVVVMQKHVIEEYRDLRHDCLQLSDDVIRNCLSFPFSELASFPGRVST